MTLLTATIALASKQDLKNPCRVQGKGRKFGKKGHSLRFFHFCDGRGCFLIIKM
jgi:hypothetical protein